MGTVRAFVFVTPILDLLSPPVGGIQGLQVIDVTEPIRGVMRVPLLAGFALALPYIVLELLLFIAPALKPKA